MDTYYAGQRRTLRAAATTVHCGMVGYRSAISITSRSKEGHLGFIVVVAVLSMPSREILGREGRGTSSRDVSSERADPPVPPKRHGHRHLRPGSFPVSPVSKPLTARPPDRTPSAMPGRQWVMVCRHDGVGQPRREAWSSSVVNPRPCRSQGFAQAGADTGEDGHARGLHSYTLIYTSPALLKQHLLQRGHVIPLLRSLNVLSGRSKASCLPFYADGPLGLCWPLPSFLSLSTRSLTSTETTITTTRRSPSIELYTLAGSSLVSGGETSP